MAEDGNDVDNVVIRRRHVGIPIGGGIVGIGARISLRAYVLIGCGEYRPIRLGVSNSYRLEIGHFGLVYHPLRGFIDR